MTASLHDFLRANDGKAALIDVCRLFNIGPKAAYKAIKETGVTMVDARTQGRRPVGQTADQMLLRAQVVDLFLNEPHLSYARIGKRCDCSFVVVSRILADYVREVALSPANPLAMHDDLRRCVTDLDHLKAAVAAGQPVERTQQALTELSEELTTLVNRLEKVDDRLEKIDDPDS